mmetsp:Transcript_38057/g.80157  ORF Transcript_38057/g.80157 Transcript_38057/m.80157 type:complete len:216 (+) Transcript_38057:899-1546(+)
MEVVGGDGRFDEGIGIGFHGIILISSGGGGKLVASKRLLHFQPKHGINDIHRSIQLVRTASFSMKRRADQVVPSQFVRRRSHNARVKFFRVLLHRLALGPRLGHLRKRHFRRHDEIVGRDGRRRSVEGVEGGEEGFEEEGVDLGLLLIAPRGVGGRGGVVFESVAEVWDDAQALRNAVEVARVAKVDESAGFDHLGRFLWGEVLKEDSLFDRFDR